MWEAIKNNVLIKTIVVVVLGVLGFGLAFNIMFGGNTGMMGQEMNGGYALESTLAYILMIMVKLLLIAIVFTALIAVYKLGKKYLFEGRDSKMFEAYKNDPIVRIASVIVVSVIVIALVAMLFGNIFGGYGMMPGYNYTMGAVGGFGLASVLIFLVKLLLVVSVVGLVASIILYIIQNPTCIDIDRVFSGTRKATSNCTCCKCGMALKSEWKCCPNCGEEVDVEEENIIQVVDGEPEIKEDVMENIDSDDSTDVYENLYESAAKETIDTTKHTENRRKQNKR